MNDRTQNLAAQVQRALALEAALDAACTTYCEMMTGEDRYGFTVDAIVLLADRAGLLEPARTADFLRALAAVLANTDSATYEAAKTALSTRTSVLLEALGSRRRLA